MNYLRLFREFVEQETSTNYVKAKMEELQDLISNLNNDLSSELIYNWDDNSGEYLVINFDIDGRPYRYELDLKYNTPYVVKKYVDNELLFQDEVDGEQEGLEVIEKDLMALVNELKGEILEKAKTRGERYKGKHIPAKYLTHKKKAMKKEIEEFRGKKVYKKDWEADYDKRSGKRVKTKKSAATKAYQRMFGNK